MAGKGKGEVEHVGKLTGAAALAAGKQSCSKCGEVKPLGEFHANSARVAGVRSKCKVCVRGNTGKAAQPVAPVADTPPAQAPAAKSLDNKRAQWREAKARARAKAKALQAA